MTTKLMKNVNDRTYQEVEYLKKSLGPILVAGLAEICIRRPADPIEYLGHWLLRWRYNEELKRRDVQNAMDVVKQRQWSQVKENAAQLYQENQPHDVTSHLPESHEHHEHGGHEYGHEHQGHEHGSHEEEELLTDTLFPPHHNEASKVSVDKKLSNATPKKLSVPASRQGSMLSQSQRGSIKAGEEIHVGSNESKLGHHEKKSSLGDSSGTRKSSHLSSADAPKLSSTTSSDKHSGHDHHEGHEHHAPEGQAHKLSVDHKLSKSHAPEQKNSLAHKISTVKRHEGHTPEAHKNLEGKMSKGHDTHQNSLAHKVSSIKNETQVLTAQRNSLQHKISTAQGHENAIAQKLSKGHEGHLIEHKLSKGHEAHHHGGDDHKLETKHSIKGHELEHKVSTKGHEGHGPEHKGSIKSVADGSRKGSHESKKHIPAPGQEGQVPKKSINGSTHKNVKVPPQEVHRSSVPPPAV